MVLDYPITVQCTILDEGFHVLITGGCRTHVGAVTVVEPCQKYQDHSGVDERTSGNMTSRTILRKSHRDDVISERVGKILCKSFHCPVLVCCGIHYDNVRKEDIQQIIDSVNSLIRNLIQIIQKSSC